MPRADLKPHPNEPQEDITPPMTLTKMDLAEHVAELGFTKKGAAIMLETLIETIKDTLENGEQVMISRFGKLYVKGIRVKKAGHHSQSLPRPPNIKRVVRFKCSYVLRNHINAKG
jgi:integration host factor subunit alpha